MQSPRVTRSGTVLGKRAHQLTTEPSTQPQCDGLDGHLLMTPDPTPNPKRVRTSVSVLDGDGNKENIPPYIGEILGISPSPRSMRSLRRRSTEIITSADSRNLRRHASMSNIRALPATPASAMGSLSLATPPSTPPSLLPLHVRARALLRPTCNDATHIAGRQSERDIIQSFIEPFLRSREVIEDCPPVLYISGAPGTGKTALVNAIVRPFLIDADEFVKVVSINCMALDGVESVWARISEALGEDTYAKTVRRNRKQKESALSFVGRFLALSDVKCILVLDEMDHVISSQQELSTVFSLARQYPGKIRIIGVANTHTLTSSSSSTLSVESMKDVKTIHFAPYTPKQLLEILMSRLTPLSEASAEAEHRAKAFLPSQTLSLLTKKIAAQTGDVRAVFEVLRGAIDLAVAATTTSDVLDAPPPVVTPSHILIALKAHASANVASPSIKPSMASISTRKISDSETVTKVQELGLHSRLALLSMMLARKRLEAGLPLSASTSVTATRTPVKRSTSVNTLATSNKANALDANCLHAFYSTILTRGEGSPFVPVSRSEFGDLLGVLETVGLLMLSSGSISPSSPSKGGKRGLSRSTSFNLHASNAATQDVRFVEGTRLEEIARGLGISDAQTDAATNIREEEVRAIWHRECSRISKDAKTSISPSKADLIEGATTS